MPGRTAETVTNALGAHLFARHGALTISISDIASEFVGEVITNLCNHYNVRETQISRGMQQPA